MSPSETSTAPGRCSSTRRRPSPTTATRASPKVVCEEKHMGSRAVIDRLPRRGVARRPVRNCRGRSTALSTPAPAAGSSMTSGSRTELLGRIRRAAQAGSGLWDELATDWIVPRLRADAVVGQGAGAAQDPVRSRRCCAAALRRFARLFRCWNVRLLGAPTSASLIESHRDRAQLAESVHRSLPQVLLARSPDRRPPSSRRSTCSQVEGKVHIDREQLVAHGDSREAERCRRFASDGDLAPGRRRDRFRVRG